MYTEQVTNDNEKSNVIFNMQENSQPSFFVPAAEQPSKSFDCREPKEFRPDPSNPPWPHTKDDGRGNFHPLDPYRGMQCVELDRDGTCDMGPEDFAGFVWVSLKMYVPSRSNCKNPHKGGPPILSPFTKYNHIPIPPPEKLKCTGSLSHTDAVNPTSATRNSITLCPTLYPTPYTLYPTLDPMPQILNPKP